MPTEQSKLYSKCNDLTRNVLLAIIIVKKKKSREERCFGWNIYNL